MQGGSIRRVFGIASARVPGHEAFCETFLFVVIDCIGLRMEVVSREGVLVLVLVLVLLLVPCLMRLFWSSCMTICFILMTSLFHGR